MFEEPDAIRKESEIKSNDEAAIWNNPLFAKGCANNRVTEEGGIIEDKSKLPFYGERFLPKVFVEN